MSEANSMNLISALSQEELQAIDAEIAHVPYRDAVAIDALKIVQAHRGWVSDESLSAIAAHLHMPMQSGDDKVLRAMNRWYDTAEYMASVERVQAALDKPALSADLLVGFPGEGDTEFANTLNTVRQIGFSRIHVFPFSARPGTPAASMKELPHPSAVRERRAALGEVARELQAQFQTSLEGSQDSLLLEEGFTGLSGRYQRVELTAPSAAHLLEKFPTEQARRGLFQVRLERAQGRLLGHLPGAPKQLPQISPGTVHLGIGGALPLL